MTYKIGALFAGYGGLDEGVQQVFGRGRVAWYAENAAGPSSLLEQRFPGVPNLGDVTTIDWHQVEPVHVLTGGSPCQDLSHAGKRAGMREGTRSGLWASMREGIAILRPSWVVWENVRGALSAGADSEMEFCEGCVGDPRGRCLRALGRVLGDLADLGYDATWTTVRASDVGAPHRRERVFVLAWPAVPDADRLGEHGPWPRGAGRAELEDRGERPRLLDLTTTLGRLLPTPAVNDMGASHTPETWDAWTEAMKLRHGNGNGHGKSLSIEAQRLLPTPTTRDHKGQNQRQDTTCLTGALLPTPRAARGGSGTETMYALGAQRSDAARTQGEVLLPTPRASEGEKGGPNQRGSSGDQTLSSVTPRLLPTATAADAGASGGAVGSSNITLTDATTRGRVDFGEYAPAIARWQAVIGRPAPRPTAPTGRDGGERLAPEFVEWMMGLPSGWVTEGGLPRAAQLKLLGNGVVPQQAAAALGLLVDDALAQQKQDAMEAWEQELLARNQDQWELAA